MRCPRADSSVRRWCWCHLASSASELNFGTIKFFLGIFTSLGLLTKIKLSKSDTRKQRCSYEKSGTHYLHLTALRLLS